MRIESFLQPRKGFVEFVKFEMNVFTLYDNTEKSNNHKKIMTLIIILKY